MRVQSNSSLNGIMTHLVDETQVVHRTRIHRVLLAKVICDGAFHCMGSL